MKDELESVPWIIFHLGHRLARRHSLAFLERISNNCGLSILSPNHVKGFQASWWLHCCDG